MPPSRPINRAQALAVMRQHQKRQKAIALGRQALAHGARVNALGARAIQMELERQRRIIALGPDFNWWRKEPSADGSQSVTGQSGNDQLQDSVSPLHQIKPQLFTGEAIALAIESLKTIAVDADRLANAIEEQGSASKEALRQDSDGNGSDDNKLYKLLKRFDRWFDVMDGRVIREGGPIDGVPTRLRQIAARARKLAAIGNDPKWPIYDLREAWLLRLSSGTESKFGENGANAHTVQTTDTACYKKENGEVIASVYGTWIAILPNYHILSGEQKAAAIAHEFVHALNRDENVSRDGMKGGHFDTTNLNFNKSDLSIRLNRTRAFINPSSWAAYIMNSEFEN